MKAALIAEFIGTYFLYLIIGLCITQPGAGNFTPIAVATGLTALVYSCGHLSKAHFNPATTVAYYCAGTHSRKAFSPYWIIIFLAATLGALTLPLLKPEGVATIEATEVFLPRALIAEFLFTFALMWVILNIAIAKGTESNGYYGITIGGIVGASAYAVGPVSLATLNPAVTLALCINGFIQWGVFLPYALCQVTAAALAGLLFKCLRATSKSELSGKPWN